MDKSILKVLKRFIRRFQINKAIYKAKKKGLYEVAEHFSSMLCGCERVTKLTVSKKDKQ